ncbi:MAG: peptidoglycan DD-metalloendopeptidase family protein [Candidatus Paceibacterota bacterium]|jgi:LysM repeat protein
MKLNTHKQTKYNLTFKRLANWIAICVSIFIITITFSETAHAGLVSFIGSMFGSEEASAKISKNVSVNSQNMPLPIVAVNFDPNPDKSFDTVPVVGGETLVADIASTNGVSTDTSTKISIYNVRSGDTYSGIAKMFNVSVNTILWANNLTSKSVLKVGQILIILPVTGIKYTVQRNDTVLGIANKYHADAGEIYSYNDLDASSKLVIGQNLIIPDAEMGLSATVSKTINQKLIYEPVIGNVSNLPSYPGYYSCPLIGGRLSQELHGRNAVDMATPIGTPLRASAAGTVIISKSNGAWNGGYGNYIVISHSNGTQTLYSHMLRSPIGPGEQVSKGQIIGYSGNTGFSTGPHLHFEIRGAKNPFVDGRCN